MECYRQRYKKCVVPGCEDLFTKKHSFPKNDTALFDKWIKQVNNPILNNKSHEQIYKSHRVCDLHFSESDRVPGTRRGLKKFAFPTLLVPGSAAAVGVPSSSMQSFQLLTNEEQHSKPCSVASSPLATSIATKLNIILSTSSVSTSERPKTPENRNLGDLSVPESLKAYDRPNLSKSYKRSFIDEHPVPSCSTSTPESTPKKAKLDSPSKLILKPASYTLSTPKRSMKARRRILTSIHVSRQTELTPKAKTLYKTLITWGNRMSVLGSRLKSYRSRLHQAEKTAESIGISQIVEKVNTTTYNFFLSQINTQMKKSKARRFSVDDKILALSLFKASGKGYRFLSKIFSLPSRKTLTNFLSKVPLKPGINHHLFKKLEESIQKKTEREKCCVVMFDEMSLSCQVQYNRKEDVIEGIDNTGSFPGIVDHTNVFLIQGVYSKWKQPVCFTFSDGPIKYLALKDMIISVIGKCQEIGLHVVATVCDQGGANQAAINSLLKDTNEHFTRLQEENKFFGFLVNNKEIIPLYDVPHLFKGLRNNLLEKDLHFYYKGKHMIAKWEHIETLYKLDSTLEDSLCFKLTDKHILKDSINKMKVSLCMQVFSHQVGSLMKRIALWGASEKTNLGPEAVDTSELLLFLDTLFDSLNVNSKIGPTTKPLKGGVTASSGHEEYWKMAIKVLDSMKFYNKEKKCFVKVPSIKNLIHTLKSFIYLKSVLLINFQFTYILTRYFNQDPLENFFSYIRSHGVRNVSPGPTHFTSSFKTLLINNFMSYHSPFSNCEKDEASHMLSNLKSFFTDVSETTDTALEPVSKLDLQILPMHKRSKISKCIITYYAGYVAKKVHEVTKKYQCKRCKGNLLAWGTNTDIDFIEAREYKPELLLRPGGFLTFIVSQAVPYLHYIIPRLSNKTTISVLLKQLLEKKIDFNPINCPEHNLKDHILALLIRCAIYFWCRKVNKICLGKDLKFDTFVRNSKSPNLIDPVKLKALKKWNNRRKLKLRYKNAK